MILSLLFRNEKSEFAPILQIPVNFQTKGQIDPYKFFLLYVFLPIFSYQWKLDKF
jgi:hypothetical protein